MIKPNAPQQLRAVFPAPPPSWRRYGLAARRAVTRRDRRSISRSARASPGPNSSGCTLADKGQGIPAIRAGGDVGSQVVDTPGSRPPARAPRGEKEREIT